jgi:uncharacterized protein
MPRIVRVMKQKGVNWRLFCLLLIIPWLVFSVAAATSWAADAESSADQTDDSSIFEMKRWSPYAAGIGIGVLSWLVFLLSDNTLGASGSYAKTAGMIERLVRGRKVEDRTYYRENPPVIDWGWMLLVGLVVGSFLSAWLSGDFHIVTVPELWKQHMGSNAFFRWLIALAGGILMGIGSRWADGCTSGHGISGTLQLVVSSWIAVTCFFIGGVVTALIIL